MKRFLAIILSLALLVTTIPTTVWAYAGEMLEQPLAAEDGQLMETPVETGESLEVTVPETTVAVTVLEETTPETTEPATEPEGTTAPTEP